MLLLVVIVAMTLTPTMDSGKTPDKASSPLGKSEASQSLPKNLRYLIFKFDTKSQSLRTMQVPYILFLVKVNELFQWYLVYEIESFQCYFCKIVNYYINAIPYTNQSVTVTYLFISYFDYVIFHMLVVIL
jgi:hypothetical protein